MDNERLEPSVELTNAEKQTKIGIYSKMFNVEYCLIALLSIVSLIFFYAAFKLIGSFSWNNIYQMINTILLILSAVAVVANIFINFTVIQKVGNKSYFTIMFCTAAKVIVYLIILSTFIMSLVTMLLTKIA